MLLIEDDTALPYNPKVSVLMITYNHEKLISQAIESVLAQETKLDYEIVIGDDCSTDNTREVISGLQQRFPSRIHLVLHDSNVGANKNYDAVLRACRGQYVAVLEGDDYWTSPYKLQKQVDFLDHHPECVMCIHNVMVVDEDGIEPPRPFAVSQREVSVIEDLFVINFIPTCSLLYRRALLPELPGWLYPLRVGDWALNILVAQHGKIGYIDEIMGVYRVHSGGAWAKKTYLYRLEATIEMLELVKAHLGFEYGRLIDRLLARFLKDLLQEYVTLEGSVNAKRYGLKLVKLRFLGGPPIDKSLLKLLLRAYAPNIHNAIKMAVAGRTLK